MAVASETTTSRAKKLADRARSERDLETLARFEQRTRLLLVLSAIMPIVVAFSRATTDSWVSITINIVAWVVFIIDLVVHMRYIRHYLRTGTGIFDLVVVILTAPWFLIPGLEGTQILQLARMARLLRIVAVTPSARLIGQRLGQVGIFAVGMLLFSSWAAYIAEHGTNTGFATYGDALWWGIVTLTTVGYGDITPQTTTGRWAGVFLMLTGVATLGIISGTLASFFKSAREDAVQDEVQRDDAVAPSVSSRDVVAELAAVRQQLASLEARLSQAPAPGSAGT